MASDDKTLRIEAHLQETIEVNSAGESVRDEAIRRQQSIEPPPASSSSVGTEDDIRRRIEEGDDSPLPEAAISAGAQAASASSAGGSGGSVVGGGGGAVGSGGSSELLVSAGALATSLETATVAVAGAVSAVVGLTTAVIGAAEALEFIQDNLLSEFDTIDPRLAGARGQQRAELIQARIDAAQTISPESVEFIAQQTATQREIAQLNANLANWTAGAASWGQRIERWLVEDLNRLLGNQSTDNLRNQAKDLAERIDKFSKIIENLSDPNNKFHHLIAQYEKALQESKTLLAEVNDKLRDRNAGGFQQDVRDFFNGVGQSQLSHLNIGNYPKAASSRAGARIRPPRKK